MPSPGQIAALFGGTPQVAASLMQQPASSFLFPNGFQGGLFGMGRPVSEWDQKTNNMANLAFNQTLQRTGNADTANAQRVRNLVGDPRDNPIVAGWGPADLGAMAGIIKAYHGSPHSFDKFSMSKIGTGEGAQAYGHGLYFAENPGTARSYATQLSPYGTIRVGAADVSIPQMPDGPQKMAAQLLLSKNFDAADARYAVHNIRKEDFSGFTREDVTREIDRLSREGAGPASNVYEVELSPNKEDLLDWDKPLSEQSEGVKKALSNVKPPNVPVNLSDADTGREIYELLTRALYDRDKVSAYLRSLGLPGIKYLDQGSRGAEGGTHNFVMFDDELVKITGRK